MGPKQRGTRGLSGFTLVEMLTAIAILAILASLALPAFGDLIKNNRRTVTLNELTAGLMLARAESTRSGRPVVICGVDDANANHLLETTERVCSGLDWRDGWMVASWGDADSDGVLDSGELQAPLRVYLNDYSGINITGSGFAAAPATGVLAMQPFNRASSTGRLTVCDARGEQRSRGIEISSTGRTRVLVNTTEDATTGTALTCP